jgi:predicted PurR-regulated permease PerM
MRPLADPLTRRRLLRVGLLLVLTGAAVLLALYLVRPVLLPLLLGVVLAYMLAPAVRVLVDRGWPVAWAIGVVYLGLGLCLAVLGLKIVPTVLGELNRVAEALPRYVQLVRAQADGWVDSYRQANLPPGVRSAVDGWIGRTGDSLRLRLTGALDGAMSMVEGVLHLALAPVVAFYLLRDHRSLGRGLMSIFPATWRRPARRILHDLDEVLGGFIRGQLLLAGAVGLLATLACWLLGLRFALLLGVFAAGAELIPYVGPLIGMAPAVLAGLMVSPVTGLQVALAFLLIQQIENAVLSPLVIGERVGLHPVVILLVVLGGGYAGGLLGMLVAVPLVAMLRVLWRHLYDYLTAPGAAVVKE